MDTRPEDDGVDEADGSRTGKPDGVEADGGTGSATDGSAGAGAGQSEADGAVEVEQPGGDPDATPHGERERPDGHQQLASMLSNQDLVMSQEPQAPDRDELFAVTGGDPDEVFPQSVASGGPTR